MFDFLFSVPVRLGGKSAEIRRNPQKHPIKHPYQKPPAKTPNLPGLGREIGRKAEDSIVLVEK